MAAYQPVDSVAEGLASKHDEALPPPLPARHDARGTEDNNTSTAASTAPPSSLKDLEPVPTLSYSEDLSDPVNYTRDPKRLTAYLVPFPKPDFRKGLFHAADASQIPDRFLIYTPPAPPLQVPKEGEKEEKIHKLQRKWQDEVRAAKASDAKVNSWKGIRSRATKGINTAMGWTTNSNLDFINRIPHESSPSKSSAELDHHADDGADEGDQTKKTVGLAEMVMVYPDTIPGTQEQVREVFVNTMLRSKTKAQRDAVLATGLLPVSFAIDVLLTLVWPFGGLLEIDGVWAAKNIRGAKTARSVTKRLNSTGSGTGDDAQLRLTFIPSQRIQVLSRYLAEEAHKVDPKYFKSQGVPPTETDVLEAIAWSPSQSGGETKNWEDEQWETSEVKDDLRLTMHKGAKEWDKWIKNFEKDPEKALKKG